MSERVKLSGVIHSAVPDEFEGEPLDLMHLCQDETCLWYDIADVILASDWLQAHDATVIQRVYDMLANSPAVTIAGKGGGLELIRNIKQAKGA